MEDTTSGTALPKFSKGNAAVGKTKRRMPLLRASDVISVGTSGTAAPNKASGVVSLGKVKSQKPVFLPSGRVQYSTNKASGATSSWKRRKLFDEASRLAKVEKMVHKDSFMHSEENQGKVTCSADSSLKALSSADDNQSIETVTKPLQAICHYINQLLSPTKEFDEASRFTKFGKLAHKASSSDIASTIRSSIQEQDSILHSEESHGKVTCSADSSLKALSLADDNQSIEKENMHSLISKDKSSQVSEQLQEIFNNVGQFLSSTSLRIEIPADQSVGMKDSIVQECMRLLNTGSKEDLKRLKGIGEKRANSILELREGSPEPFKSLDELKNIGLSAKQIEAMIKARHGQHT